MLLGSRPTYIFEPFENNSDFLEAPMTQRCQEILRQINQPSHPIRANEFEHKKRLCRDGDSFVISDCSEQDQAEVVFIDSCQIEKPDVEQRELRIDSESSFRKYNQEFWDYGVVVLSAKTRSPIGYWVYGYAGAELNSGTVIDMQDDLIRDCLLYTSPSPRDKRQSRMPSSA